MAGLDELTDEQRAELGTLGTEHQDTEAQLRAAIASSPDADPAVDPTVDPTVDPEVRERLELRGRASFGRYLAADADRSASGRARGRVPSGEQRCRVSRSTSSSRTGLSRSELTRPAAYRQPGPGPHSHRFSRSWSLQSIAPMLGIEMPSVGSGAYSEMTISTSLTAAAKAKAGKQESTAAVLTPTTANPRSIRGRLTLNLEDIAAIGQTNFESALRQNAQAVVSDALDTQVITGNGTAPNLDGLINQLTDPTETRP